MIDFITDLPIESTGTGYYTISKKNAGSWLKVNRMHCCFFGLLEEAKESFYNAILAQFEGSNNVGQAYWQVAEVDDREVSAFDLQYAGRTVLVDFNCDDDAGENAVLLELGGTRFEYDGTLLQLVYVEVDPESI